MKHGSLHKHVSTIHVISVTTCISASSDHNLCHRVWNFFKLIRLLLSYESNRSWWPNEHVGLEVEWPWFEPWLWLLCCVLGQDTKLSHCLSPPSSIWVRVCRAANNFFSWKDICLTKSPFWSDKTKMRSDIILQYRLISEPANLTRCQRRVNCSLRLEQRVIMH